MCGIIGINEQNEELIRVAGQSFKYRGPDASAVFSDSLVTLGHYRLAIQDLDERSTQPMFDTDKKIGIVFNGEIYNFKEVKARLEEKYSFRTTSDTEVIIYAYKEWGIEMTKYIQGMFALAIYDLERQKVLLFRDHAGIKPLCYYACNGIFVFASEIKGVLSALHKKNIVVNIDQKMIDLYLMLGYVPSPNTIYSDVLKLEKGTYVEYDLVKKEISSGGIYKASYTAVTSKKEYVDLIEKKILAHLISDVPVGVFFSGGTDSSLIAAVLNKHKINLETFSININYKSDDAFHFNKISEYLKLKSQVFDFGVKELDGIYEEVMSKIDEPSYDNSIFPTYFVSKKASEKVKVVLSGEGGDEYFYGYARSKVFYNLNTSTDYSVSFLDYLYLFSPSFKSKNYFFEKLFSVTRKPISYFLVSSPLRDRANLRQWKIAKREFEIRNLKPLDIDKEFYLENDLLRKTDFATSYVSIEGRVPLLDIDIIRNASLVEYEKLEGGVLKAFLKEMLSNYLPKELVYRSKSGFGINIAAVFKDSQFLRPDLMKAMEYLEARNIYSIDRGDVQLLTEKYAHACFALVSLYRSIRNNENV